MTQRELDRVIADHRLWLESVGEQGKRADLTGVNLTGLNMSGADMTWAIMSGANLTGLDMTGIDMTGAIMAGAIITGAKFAGTNIDYSCWPLWCGSLDVIVDKRIFAQLAYHLCRLLVDDPECIAAQNALADIANQFHRADECGGIELKEVPQC